MINTIVFHSGNPSWRSCRMAIGIANKMKEKFGDKIELNIYLNDDEEAKNYQLFSSTNVFVEDQLVSREIALDEKKMSEFLTEIISKRS